MPRTGHDHCLDEAATIDESGQNECATNSEQAHHQQEGEEVQLSKDECQTHWTQCSSETEGHGHCLRDTEESANELDEGGPGDGRRPSQAPSRQFVRLQ